MALLYFLYIIDLGWGDEEGDNRWLCYILYTSLTLAGEMKKVTTDGSVIFSIHHWPWLGRWRRWQQMALLYFLYIIDLGWGDAEGDNRWICYILYTSLTLAGEMKKVTTDGSVIFSIHHWPWLGRWRRWQQMALLSSLYIIDLGWGDEEGDNRWLCYLLYTSLTLAGEMQKVTTDGSVIFSIHHWPWLGRWRRWQQMALLYSLYIIDLGWGDEEGDNRWLCYIFYTSLTLAGEMKKVTTDGSVIFSIHHWPWLGRCRGNTGWTESLHLFQVHN